MIESQELNNVEEDYEMSPATENFARDSKNEKARMKRKLDEPLFSNEISRPTKMQCTTVPFFSMSAVRCPTNQSIDTKVEVEIHPYYNLTALRINSKYATRISQNGLNATFKIPISTVPLCADVECHYCIDDVREVHLLYKNSFTYYQETHQEQSIETRASSIDQNDIPPIFFPHLLALNHAEDDNSTVASSSSGYGFASASLNDFSEDKASNKEKLLDYFVREYNIPLKEYATINEIVLEAVNEDIRALRDAPPDLLDDREFVLPIVQQDGRALEFVSDRLKDTTEIVHAACFGSTSGDVLKYVSDRIKDSDHQLISKVLGTMYSVSTIKNCDQTNIQDLFEAAINYEVEAFQYASSTLRNDKQFVLKVVKANGSSLKFASESLKNDYEVLQAAIEQDPETIQYATDSLRRFIETVKNL